METINLPVRVKIGSLSSISSLGIEPLKRRTCYVDTKRVERAGYITFTETKLASVTDIVSAIPGVGCSVPSSLRSDRIGNNTSVVSGDRPEGIVTVQMSQNERGCLNARCSRNCGCEPFEHAVRSSDFAIVNVEIVVNEWMLFEAPHL